MIYPGKKYRWLVLAVLLGCLLPRGYAQNTDDAYAAERRQAGELLGKHNYLEALPILEDLAKKNPNDDSVLVGLAQCLLSHSATLQDQTAADAERLRAKTLLEKAKELGNQSTLLQNLLQLMG
ncbi:MAG: hypothetical protein ACRD5L_01550, partial [Bryobacteraceae bacterium]